MIITSSIVLLSFISVLLFTLACYLTGYVLQIGANKFGRKRVYSFFDKLFFGFLLVTSLYAIFITHGTTILVILPPVIIYLFFLKEKGTAYGEKIATKNIIIFFTGVIVFSFLFYLQGYVSFNGDGIKYLGGDLSYYARIAQDLNMHHIENIRVERFYPDVFGVEPYHYLDIWPAALISKVTGLNTHFSLVLVCLPFFTLLFAFGVLELLISLGGNKKIVYWLAGISILVSGLPFLSPGFFIHSDIYNAAISSFPKALLPGCILLFFINQYWFGRRNTAIILTIACIVAFINIAPPLILAIGIVGLSSIFRKEVLIKSFLPSFICVTAIAGYLLWFYNNGDSVAMKSTIGWFGYIKTAIAIFIVTPVHIIFLLPLLIIIVFLKRKHININNQVRDANLFFSVVILAGITSYAIFWSITSEAVQFFSNLFIPSVAILSVVGCIMAFQVSPKWIGYTYFLLLIGVSLYNLPAKNNGDIVKKTDYLAFQMFTKGEANPIFVNHKSISDYNTFFSRNTRVYQPLSFANYLFTRYDNVSLDVLTIEPDSSGHYFEIEKSNLSSTPFSKYAELNNKDLTIDSLYVSFVKNNNVSYLTVSPFAQAPACLLLLSSDSLRLSDGWRIYRLKK